MKVSQIVALSATLIFRAQACVRVRVDRRISQKDQSALVQDVKLYDNDNPVVTLPRPINFSLNDEDTDLDLGSGYKITLRYDRNGPTPDHPYGGTITYPKGPNRDLQGKAWSTYVDGEGRKHDVYCFSDNYDNCGAYSCGI